MVPVPDTYYHSTWKCRQAGLSEECSGCLELHLFERERLLDAGQKCFPNGMWLGRKESAGGLGRGKQDTDLELNSRTQGLDLRARPPGLKWCQLGGEAGVVQLSLKCSSVGLN